MSGYSAISCMKEQAAQVIRPRLMNEVRRKSSKNFSIGAKSFVRMDQGEQAVAGVAEVVAFLPLHAVLNDLLHAVVEGVDTELPHRQ